MSEWTEETIVVCVPVTLEYDPSRVGRAYLVAEAERGLTNALQHIAGHYRIEGGKAAVHPACHVFSQKNLTLTDAEREAVETSFDAMQYAADELGLSQADCDRLVATLRGLLERTQ